MEFSLLGPVEARVGDHRVDVGHARQQCVLVTLLVEINQVVPTEALIDRVWGEKVPVRARDTLYNYLSRLRQALARVDDLDIGRRPGGYQLTANPAAVDLHHFRDLVGQARRTEDDERAAALFEQALRLWRGEAFANLDTPWLNRMRIRLEAEKRAAELNHTDLELRLGRHGDLLAGLEPRVADHPLDERLAGQLMLALYRGGRQADALRVYQRARTALVETLGVEPGAELHQLHQRILTTDPELVIPTPTRERVPAQLPLAAPGFTGRAAQLAELDEVAAGSGGSVVISAVSGTGGIGKTALALHWAHRVAARYPDGQLYADLHGYATTEPVQPADVLGRFLRALGFTADRLPVDVDEAAALYRSLLADKRVLIVLDNAANVDQVRPLLPGSAGSLVLITSRDRLDGLIVAEGARRLSLDVLNAGESVALLASGLGEHRVTAELDAAHELADLCGHLPLALRIVTANLAARPAQQLSDAVDALRRDRLGPLTVTGDAPLSIRDVFIISYRRVPAPGQRLFRLLGIAPGPDISAPAAAVLADIDPTHALPALDHLVASNLLRQDGERYSFHDLVGVFARERAAADETPAEQQAALNRLSQWYLTTASAAARLLWPDLIRLPDDAGNDNNGDLRAMGHTPFGTDPLGWLEAEADNLAAVITHNTTRGRNDAAGRLNVVLRTVHEMSAGRTAEPDSLDSTTQGAARTDAAIPAFVRLTPAQLPANIGDFVGRASELATARAALTASSGAGAPVLVISGMPGVGKSAFAVKLAHEVRTRFPDGQLFIDLHGYSEHTPLSPARVLSRILPALGLPSTQVPTDPEDLTNTYRSLVADRRILLVLDNAANAQQVHDLIPAAPESAVLITSRSQLPGLAALTRARLLQLVPLKPREAEQLVRTILATAPGLADVDIGQIIELCGHLPLAMRVAATTYLHSARPLPEFIAELEQHDRLAALSIADDPRATVRAVFDLSYRTLTAAAARLFRLLSLVPGPDFCRSCAQHVAAVPAAQAEQLLGELTAASLIHPGRPRHYRFHDLVRLYAHDRCVTEDDPDDLHTALARLHSYYVTTADAAADALYPTWIRLPRTHPSLVAAEPAPAVPNAAQWMSDEAPNLIATIRYTAQHGPVAIAWYLSESLRAYLVTHGAYRIEALGAFEIALNAARDAENRRAMANMHHSFCSVYLRIRDVQRALPHLRAALSHHLELEFAKGETLTRAALGEALAKQGYLRDAVTQMDEALRIAEQHDFTELQPFTLLNFSAIEEQRDQLDAAKKYALAAFDLIDATSNTSTKGVVHGVLGRVMIRQGEFDAAIEQHLLALERYRQAGDQHYESGALRGLAHAYSKTGDIKASIAHGTKALAVAEELGDEYDITDSLISLAEIYHELDLTAQAHSHAESALRMSDELAYTKAHIEALLQLASIDKTEDRLDRAQEHVHRAIELAHQGELLRLRGDAETLLAWITHEKGDHTQALRHATNAFAIHQEVNSPYGQTRALHVKGLALLAQGQREQAKIEWTTSLEIFQGPATPEIDMIRKAVAEIS